MGFFQDSPVANVVAFAIHRYLIPAIRDLYEVGIAVETILPVQELLHVDLFDPGEQSTLCL